MRPAGREQSLRKLERVIQMLDRVSVDLDDVLQDLFAMPNRVNAGAVRRNAPLAVPDRVVFSSSIVELHFPFERIKVYLPPRVLELLKILSEDTQPSSEDIIGWKSRQELREHLSSRWGVVVSDHGLDQLVHRLRSSLGSHACEHILQSRHGFLRIAIRKSRSKILDI
jgi:hypothetical protein